MACGLAPRAEWTQAPRLEGCGRPLTAREAALLARFGNYHAIVVHGARKDDLIGNEIVRSAQRVSGLAVDLAAATPRSDREGTAFSRHACDVLAISALVRAGEIEKATTLLTESQRVLARWTNHDEWLSRFAELRLESLSASISYYSCAQTKAVDRWAELAAAALNIHVLDPARRWSINDFARHRLSRVARHLIAATSDAAVELTSAVLDLDPYDARAWQLHGTALMHRDVDAARQAYELATQLDPTVEADAGLLAARAAGYSRRSARARLLVQRALDAPVGPLNKGTRLGPWSGAELAGPLDDWARRAPEVRLGWYEELYGPIIALRSGGNGPLFSRTPLLALARMQEVDQSRAHWLPNVQRAVMPDLRREICLTARLPNFAVDDPTALPSRLRSEGWDALVAALVDWSDSGEARRSAILAVLLSIGMHRYAFNLLRRTSMDENALSDRLTYIRAFCEYILFAKMGWFGYKPIAFERLAEQAAPGSRAAFMASLVTGVHYAKVEKSAEPAEAWLIRARAHLQQLEVNWPNPFSVEIWRSRWNRAYAFLPFLRGDAGGALEQLSLALSFNDLAKVTTQTEAVVKSENRQTILQTICKTALHFGDPDMALDHAQQYVDADPLDGGGWLELGEVHFFVKSYDKAADAYLTAALLGPPGDRIGRYMAGEAAARGGRVGEAMIDFMASLAADSEGESPRRRIGDLNMDGTMFARLGPLLRCLRAA